MTVLAIVFSTLMPAQANIADHHALDQCAGQQELGSHKAVHDSITSSMVLACNTSDDGLKSSHDEAECCSAMCGSAVLITAIVLSDEESTHTHLASSEAQMKSVDDTRLMRPPSL